MNLWGRVVRAFRMAHNERIYRRMPTDIPIVVRGGEADAPSRELLGNWSPGGVFVRTKSILPLESAVDIEFSLGETKGSILKLRGQVVRHQAHPSTGEYEGYGVMFTDFTQSGLLILRDLLTKSFSDSV